jgi:hypothetical protein
MQIAARFLHFWRWRADIPPQIDVHLFQLAVSEADDADGRLEEGDWPTAAAEFFSLRRGDGFRPRGERESLRGTAFLALLGRDRGFVVLRLPPRRRGLVHRRWVVGASCKPC